MGERQGVLLYGPPTSGKDTVTTALRERASRYRQFERLKFGPGRTTGYRMGGGCQLAALEASGDVIYMNSRYASVYVVDRPGLDEAFAGGVPVVHLGQVEGLKALLDGYPANWVSVLLWCSRETTAVRSQGRGDDDTAQRLAAWDATRQDLEAHPNWAWDLRINTEDQDAGASALLIDQLLAQRAGAPQA